MAATPPPSHPHIAEKALDLSSQSTKEKQDMNPAVDPDCNTSETNVREASYGNGISKFRSKARNSLLQISCPLPAKTRVSKGEKGVRAYSF